MASSFNNKYANVLFKCANLKACKSVKFRFNPWRIDAKSIRMSFTKFHAQHFRASNPKCTVMTDIRSDNFEPEIEINFIDDTTAIFKTKALTAHDIAKHFNRLSMLKAPKEESTEN